MTTMHHHHDYRPSPLEIKQLAEFDASLGEIPVEEKRRKRMVYLKDARPASSGGGVDAQGIWVLPDSLYHYSDFLAFPAFLLVYAQEDDWADE